MNRVSCLIVSSSIDYSTDYVCIAMRNQGAAYLRLNRDQFDKYEILFDL